ncbi:MAG: hypothetical protein Q4A01_11225 [Coriobacteriales bacterium]|nr:hypothetical protein [Coriobacteriales bacterium]
MTRVLFSIHPKFAELIIGGAKRYELRRCPPRRCDVDCFAIYATLPVGGVVAEGRIKGIVSLPPDDLWRIVGKDSGLEKPAYDEYFQGVTIAHAIELCDVEAFTRAVPLTEYAPALKRPPQSFAYVES